MFPGPTGTNAVEAALKVARKATGRTRVVSFTNGFHGMTLGALALTGNRAKRSGAGIPLDGATVVPFDGYLGDGVDTLPMIERMLSDRSSGLDLPAAFVLETVQAEGGVRVASAAWLRGLAALARRYDVLLVIDDIQVGCGRTGPFFSFEPAGIRPDLVCLSKSLSGFGLPMSMVLIRPELDVLAPGEHNGTFRGHMPAFVTAARALDRWTDRALQDKVAADAAHVGARLRRAVTRTGIEGQVVGRGLIQGLRFADQGLAVRLARAAFEHGLVIETAGAEDEVLKLLPPLTIDRDTLDAGLDVIDAVLGATTRPAAPRPPLEERA
jgi:diaminobutyrate-2-oxoglutarate transaminase